MNVMNEIKELPDSELTKLFYECLKYHTKVENVANPFIFSYLHIFTQQVNRIHRTTYNPNFFIPYICYEFGHRNLEFEKFIIKGDDK